MLLFFVPRLKRTDSGLCMVFPAYYLPMSLLHLNKQIDESHLLKPSVFLAVRKKRDFDILHIIANLLAVNSSNVDAPVDCSVPNKMSTNSSAHLPLIHKPSFSTYGQA